MVDKKLVWDIKIEGKSARDNNIINYIDSVSFTVEKNLMTTMTISLLNPLTTDNHTTKNIFTRGRLVSFYCGWDKLEYIGTCLIENIDIDVSGERITFTGFDKGKEMAREEKDEVWKNTTDSSIAMILALKYGFVPKIDQTTPKVSRVQHHITDYKFLNNLAWINGYAFYTVFNDITNYWELHFEKPKEFTATNNTGKIYKYYYAGDKSLVINFNPTISGNVYRDTTITLNAYLFDEKQSKSLSKDAKTDKLITLTGKVADRVGNEIIERRFQNEQEAKMFLDNLIKSREEAYMTATATVVGNTDLKCLDYVYFGGFNFKFFDDIDGYWRMDKVKHTIAPEHSVFVTSLDLVRVAKNENSLYKVSLSHDNTDFIEGG